METNIGKAIRTSGKTQDEVARALGVSRQAVTRWVSGKTPTYGNLIKLSNLLGVSVSEITGESEIGHSFHTVTDVSEPVSSGLVRVPVLSVEASCGCHGVRNEETDIVGAIDFEPYFLRSLPGVTGLSNLHIVHAHGDSMEPTIPSRSICVVDANQNQIRGDGIYCLGAEGDTFIKRIQKNLDGTLTLLSDNDRYPPQRLDKATLETVKIEGRVVLVLKVDTL